MAGIRKGAATECRPNKSVTSLLGLDRKLKLMIVRYPRDLERTGGANLRTILPVPRLAINSADESMRGAVFLEPVVKWIAVTTTDGKVVGESVLVI